jgi:hypothetical protein
LSSFQLKVFYDSVVIGMGPDPEPNHVIVGFDAQGSPTQPDTDGKDGLDTMHLLVAKHWISGVLSPKVKGFFWLCAGPAREDYGRLDETFW